MRWRKALAQERGLRRSAGLDDPSLAVSTLGLMLLAAVWYSDRAAIIRCGVHCRVC